jgi:hypothetical protein
MFYHPLNERKPEIFDKCISITKIVLMLGTTTFSFLTFMYLKILTTSLQHLDITETLELFQEIKECIIKSHICG